MKTIIVPKTAIPPKEYTMVVQMTKLEAEALLEAYNFVYRIGGYKPLGYKTVVDSVNEFLEFCGDKVSHCAKPVGVHPADYNCICEKCLAARVVKQIEEKCTCKDIYINGYCEHCKNEIVKYEN